VRLRLLERGYRDLPLHRWEIIKEVFEGMSALNVVNQCVDGNPGTHEPGGTAENFGSE